MALGRLSGEAFGQSALFRPQANISIFAMEEDGDTFVVVSDREGFVGAFPTASDAQAALQKYPNVSFVFTRWKRGGPLDEDRSAWILPYTSNNVVAAASLNRDVVAEAQRTLMRLDLVPPDELEYWEAEVGKIAPSASRRLDLVLDVADTVNRTTPGPDEQIVQRFLDFAAPARPEEKYMDLLENVVPTSTP